MEGSLSANWSFEWSKINIPTLVMTGHLDKMFRIPEDIEELVKKIKNSRKIELPNCGYLIPLEEPEEFSDHVINFANNLNQVLTITKISSGKIEEKIISVCPNLCSQMSFIQFLLV